MPPASAQAPAPRLDRIRDDQLLNLRFKDLPISIDASPLADRIDQLHTELADRGIRFRPHAWLSDEWFTPTDTPGIAIPFYLAHPRLIKLERHMMLEAEGADARSCMKILRHEAGHTIQIAHELHRRKRWQNLFGPSSTPYPTSYRPQPFSRRFVQHLDNYYAQAHPDEDFAETFAVWLTPRLNWRKLYADWPALEKLEYIDELMHELGPQKPRTTSRRKPASITTLTTTLRDHYEKRRRFYGVSDADVYARDLRALFNEPATNNKRARRAATFLRKYRAELVNSAARWTNQYRYTVDTIMNEMIERAEALELRVPDNSNEDKLKTDACSLLTVLAMNQSMTRGHRIRL